MKVTTLTCTLTGLSWHKRRNATVKTIFIVEIKVELAIRITIRP